MANDETPRTPRLTRSETRVSLESFNWSAMLRIFYDTVCGGNTFMFVAFALSLGVRRERIGLLTSIMSFACLAQFAGLVVLNRVRNMKRYIITMGLIEPIVFMAAVLTVPLLPAGIRVWALSLAVLAAAASLQLTRPATDNWLASLIPAGIRGRYLGRRFQATGAITILATLVAGYVGDRVAKDNTAGFGVVLAAAGVFGILAVLALRPAAMPALSSSSRFGWADVRQMLREKPFVRYVLFVTLFNLPFMLACPYYQVFYLEVVGMTKSAISWMMAGYFCVRILATPLWGRILDRWGARRTGLLIGPGYILYFAFFLIAGEGRSWPMFAAWAYVAVFEAGWAVTVTSALYDAVPQTPARPAYFAVASQIGTACMGLGALAGVPILEALKDIHVNIGPLALGQFHLFYALCTLLMVPCSVSALTLARRKAA